MIFLKNVKLAMGNADALVLAGSIKPIALRECVWFTHTHTADGCKNLYSALFGQIHEFTKIKTALE